jgi:hypothetical protein
MSRPILYTTYTWTPLQGAPFSATFDPWSGFYGNKRVINRLNNYQLLKSKLHVRFVINGNGFYYGRLMADYTMLPNVDDVTSTSTLVAANAIPASQRMKVFIDPSCECSQQLELPFVYYKDCVSPVTSEWAELGRVTIRELVGLKHANASTQAISITVFLWASEVEFAVPTSVSSAALVVQAGDDEYGDTPVAHAATAISAAAGALSRAPVIGPYARATSMASGAMAAIARQFGFSRPAIIDPPVVMRPTYVSNYATTDVADASSKLTVDSKQEVSIDANIIGVDAEDELIVANLASRESYLTQFAWTTAASAGALLWNTYVTPVVTNFTTPSYYLPACAFVALPFQYWRGKMRYRFQVVASNYHKGRLRITWDPQYVASLEANVQYNRVVDISTERDVVVEIDWGQPLHYLAVPGISNSNTRYGTTAKASASPANSNGVLAIHVLNNLATPNSVANNDIMINVFVSLVDGEFAAPTALPQWANPYSLVVQAGDDEEGQVVVDGGNDPGTGTPESEVSMGVDATHDNDNLVYFGERIVSFRQLLKRYYYHSSYALAPGSTSNCSLYNFSLYDVPDYLGYNANSLHVTTTGAKKFNYVRLSLLHYLAPAFVAMRGAHRSKYLVTGDALSATTYVGVERGASTGASINLAPTTLPTTSQSDYSRAIRPTRLAMAAGGTATLATRQPVLEVEFPYYTNARFDSARTINNDTSGGYVSSPWQRCHNLEVMMAPISTRSNIDRYVSVGEDFSLFLFQGCPAVSFVVVPG